MTSRFESLTGFQRDLLYVISGLDRPPGQEVKTELERRIGPITHGRLYPNLDTLVETGFVLKGQHNRRTNFYELTGDGWQAILDRKQWERQYVPTLIDDVPAIDQREQEPV